MYRHLIKYLSIFAFLSMGLNATYRFHLQTHTGKQYSLDINENSSVRDLRQKFTALQEVKDEGFTFVNAMLMGTHGLLKDSSSLKDVLTDNPDLEKIRVWKHNFSPSIMKESLDEISKSVDESLFASATQWNIIHWTKEITSWINQIAPEDQKDKFFTEVDKLGNIQDAFDFQSFLEKTDDAFRKVVFQIVLETDAVINIKQEIKQEIDKLLFSLNREYTSNLVLYILESLDKLEKQASKLKAYSAPYDRLNFRIGQAIANAQLDLDCLERSESLSRENSL